MIRKIRNKLNRFLNSYDGIFFDVIYHTRDLFTKYIVFKNQVYLFFYWGWLLRDSQPWDSCKLTEIMYLKFKQMYEYYQTDLPYCSWAKQVKFEDDEEGEDKVRYRHFKALRICYKILERIYTDYYDKYENKMTRLYGDYEICDSTDGGKFRKFSMKRTKQTDENADEIWAKQLELDNFYRNMKKRDFHILVTLLEQHYEYWWD